jgi:hypothetical protein
MSLIKGSEQTLNLQALTGHRLGPYCSFNPVSRTQIWQWCSAIADQNLLYLDDAYRCNAGYDRVVAPPAMMQMWTMRDVNMRYAPGSTDAPPYQVFDTLHAHGFPGNLAVSYDITFHHLLRDGDRAQHYTTIVAISELKQTALGEGFFITERAEFLDQDEAMFADALITYFQYKPKAHESDVSPAKENVSAKLSHSNWQSDFQDLSFQNLCKGQPLPELVIPITHKLIVSGAIASQDYIDVHHNAPEARAAGMPDIFMNILTTNGLCARYLSDWAGPGSRLKKMRFKLMAPNTPGDTMVMQGHIEKLQHHEGEPLATVEFVGRNGIGLHVTGAATLALGE